MMYDMDRRRRLPAEERAALEQARLRHWRWIDTCNAFRWFGSME